ncbi:MAG: hypothetical protein KIH64_016235 [Mycobacterium sp.]|nr:hypothetical protein [Mycobacterium sp.]
MARLRSVLAIVTAMLISIVCPIVTTPASAVTAFTVSGTRTTHDPPFPEQLLPGYFAGT